MITTADGIWTVPDFFSKEECASLIVSSETAGYEAAGLTTVNGQQIQKEVRNNSRLIFDRQDLAVKLWDRARVHVPLMLNGRQALGFNERFRFYRYDPGEQFAGHIDAPFRRDNGEVSQLTFMIYLNDDYEGGQTKFDDAVVLPKCGMPLIFRHELFHEGAVLVKGRKYVLRT